MLGAGTHPSQRKGFEVGFVTSGLEMLRRKDNEVHAEAFALLRMLARQEALTGTILMGLRPLLRSTRPS